MSSDCSVDLIVNQKASFEVIFAVQSNNAPFDLTGYTAAAKFKPVYTDSDDKSISFTSSIPDAANGKVKIVLSPEQTANMSLPRYVYDVAITSGSGFKTRIIQGTIKVSGGVT